MKESVYYCETCTENGGLYSKVNLHKVANMRRERAAAKHKAKETKEEVIDEAYKAPNPIRKRKRVIVDADDNEGKSAKYRKRDKEAFKQMKSQKKGKKSSGSKFHTTMAKMWDEDPDEEEDESEEGDDE